MILSWNCKYLVVGKELGESGTPHYQGFVIFNNNYRFVAVKRLCDRMHWEITHATSAQAADYCKKDGNFSELGTLNEQGKRTDLAEAVATLKESGIAAVAREHTETFVKYSRGLRDAALFLQDSYCHPDVRGWWIHGPPGTGKSHAARMLSSLFIKDQNKWWDGYDGEENVLLDDLDSRTLGHHLKIWADKWPCKGETKGGTVFLRYKRFIVTSNYTPQHFWGDDDAMCEAIWRRFHVYEKETKEQMIPFEEETPSAIGGVDEEEGENETLSTSPTTVIF